MALLQNAQLNETGHNVDASYQGSEYNAPSAAFTSFAGTNITEKQKLWLLSSVSNWSNIWIVDTRASDHMCHNKALFTNCLGLSKPTLVTLPNGKSVTVTYSRNVNLNSSLALHGVLYIPSFKYNMLSVNKFCNHEGCYMVFTPKCCIMQAPSVKRPQVLGEHFEGLYLL